MNRRFVVGLLVVCGFAMSGTHAAGLADAVEKVKPGVVLVGTFKATDTPRFQLRGTGFLVGNGQLVVTNAHVLPDAAPSSETAAPVVRLMQSDGNWLQFDVHLLEKDAIHDLALLRVKGPAGQALKLGESDRVREGQDLAFMGFPIGGVLGFSPVTHRATVSSITDAALPSPTARQLQERAVRGLRNGTFGIFQLDGTAYPGNSGGPLFDPQSGEVLGVMNMVLIKGTRESALSQPSGISYAIPSKHVTEMLNRHLRP